MNARSRRFFAAKSIIIVFTILLGFIGFINFPATSFKVDASVFGPSPSYTNAPLETNCTACHTSFAANSGTGNVVITGIPANYLPGQQIPLTVTVSQSDAVIYGFQMTAIDGQGRSVGTYTLPASVPQQLQLRNNIINGNLPRTYIEHTSDGVIPTQFGLKSWTFNWTAPPERVGRIGFYSAGNAANGNGGSSGDQIYTTSGASFTGTAISNFNADGISDIAVYRPSNGMWYLLTSNGNYREAQFGLNGDKIVPGDYDGDGITDLAVWRPSNGRWYLSMSTGGYYEQQWGLPGDIPVPGDYDGDLKTDLAVWRPSDSNWYIVRSSDGAISQQRFGITTDKPVQGDYDADGRTDIAVWRPETGTWYMLASTSGYSETRFGLTGDRPVQGDYDGDGKTDIALFRPSNSTWYTLNSRQGYSEYPFGLSSDIPVPADFDGDGRTDIAVYRNNTWYILASNGPTYSERQFGITGDVPVPSGYIPE